MKKINYKNYSTLGFVPIPIRYGTKKPLTPKWQETTRETSLQLFENINDKYNVGLLCGEKSGFFVWDFDNLTGKNKNKKTLKFLNQLKEKYPIIQKTVIQSIIFFHLLK